MKRVFKTIHGEIVDVVKHTLEVMKQHPNVEIHVGSDSQNNKRFTYYSTVIAYRYGTRGVHYIFTRHRVPKIRDLWSRLWKEAELSIELAEWITKQINVKIEIDLDFNIDPVYKSNSLVNASKGWANSLGYKVNLKPECQIASRAADYNCL